LLPGARGRLSRRADPRGARAARARAPGGAARRDGAVGPAALAPRAAASRPRARAAERAGMALPRQGDVRARRGDGGTGVPAPRGTPATRDRDLGGAPRRGRRVSRAPLDDRAERARHVLPPRGMTAAANGDLVVWSGDAVELEGWSASAAPGSRARLAVEPGPGGRSLRLDFDLAGPGAWAVARRAIAATLPRSWVAALALRGAAPSVELQVKL